MNKNCISSMNTHITDTGKKLDQSLSEYFTKGFKPRNT